MRLGMLLAMAAIAGVDRRIMAPPDGRNPCPEPRPEPVPVRTAEDERRLEAARQKRAACREAREGA